MDMHAWRDTSINIILYHYQSLSLHYSFFVSVCPLSYIIPSRMNWQYPEPDFTLVTDPVKIQNFEILDVKFSWHSLECGIGAYSLKLTK